MENGKWLVIDNGDIAWFLKVENETPVLKANWLIGSLGLLNNNHSLKKVVEADVENMKDVSENMKNALNQLDIDGKAFWAMSGSLKNPRPHGKPYGTLNKEDELEEG
ncbi:hypothetical protein D3C86_1309070 [compost metagenome]